jgi:multicomponent Na+:H+ antiporter subunit D
VADLAPLIVAGPFFVAALLAAGFPMSRRRNDLIGVVTASATTVFAGLLLLEATKSDEPVVSRLGGWAPRGDVILGINFAFDVLGAGIALLAALLVTAALVFAWRFFDAVGPIFHALMLVFLAAMCGFALTGDLFNLFVFFELMSVSAYTLTAYRSEESAPLQGALTFAISNSVGAVLILFGIGLLYGRTGALNMAQVGEALAGKGADGLVIVSFCLIAAGFMVKAAIVPFHFWLSDAYAVAPTPACVVFSGVMSDLGIYAVARIYWTVYADALPAEELRVVLVCAGAFTAVLGAVMCLAQLHLKRLLAFVTISQIGLVLIGVGLLSGEGLAGAVLFAGADGLLRAGLFILFGAMLHRIGELDEASLCGRGRDLPWPAGALFVAGALGLAALPPLGAFAGKGFVDHAAESVGYWWVPIVVVGTTIITAGCLLRAAGRIFLGWGTLTPRHFSRWREEHETVGGHHRTPPIMLWAAGALIVLGLLFPLAPGVVDGIDDAAARFTDREAYAAAVYDRPAPGPVAEAEPRHESALDVSLALLSVLGAVALALAILRRPGVRLPGGLQRVAEHGFFRLRRLHSGQVGDYVAWLTVGVAAFGGALALALG